MAQRIPLLWPVTAAITAAACLAFGVIFYPRGPSEETKYAHAATRKSAMDVLSKGFDAHVAGHVEEAIPHYLESMKIDSTIGLGHFFLGTALATTDKSEDAAKEFDLAIALMNKPAHVYNSRGALRVKKGDTAGGVRDFDTALKIDPKFLPPRINRGLVLLREGKADKALVEFDAVIAMYESPSNGTPVYEARAIARAMKGDLKGAAADLNDAVDYNNTKSNRLSALYNRAHLREATGDLAGAQADRAEYARLKDVPESAKEFLYPLKGGSANKTKEGAKSNGL